VQHRTGARIDMKRTLLAWSSGKDSAWSLHLLRQQNEYEIVGLLTTFNQAANRVAMHAVRRSLVEAQAKAAGVPLWDVDLPWPCSNADYECIMKKACESAVRAGIECVAFGDSVNYAARNLDSRTYLSAPKIMANTLQDN